MVSQLEYNDIISHNQKIQLVKIEWRVKGNNDFRSHVDVPLNMEKEFNNTYYPVAKKVTMLTLTFSFIYMMQ